MQTCFQTYGVIYLPKNQANEGKGESIDSANLMVLERLFQNLEVAW